MFKKNQLVHLIASWDNKAKMYVIPAIVTGCGKKQMTLIAREGGACLGRNFKPQVAQYGRGMVVADLTDDQALVLGQFEGETMRQEEMGGYVLRQLGNQDDPRYCRAIQKDLDDLKARKGESFLRNQN